MRKPNIIEDAINSAILDLIEIPANNFNIILRFLFEDLRS